MKKNILFTIIILLVAFAGIFFVIKSSETDLNSHQSNRGEVFKTQEECEKKTGKVCVSGMCDYKCKDYWKGWVVTNENLPIKLSCEQLYEDIDNELKQSNYCNVDTDCKELGLGGAYIKFGCYHFINKEIDENLLYKRIDGYTQKCTNIINDCARAPEPMCVNNKCVSRACGTWKGGQCPGGYFCKPPLDCENCEDFTGECEKVEDSVFYEQRASWGPCANPEGGCFLNTYVYTSGKLVLESKTTEEKQISKEEVNEIIKEIKNSGIMEKECDYSPVLDLSKYYKINLDGKIKKITFPGCEDELKTIDDYIDNLIKNKNISSCLDKYPKIEYKDCVPGEVVDGFSQIVLYPNNLDTTGLVGAADMFVPKEIKDSGVASYGNSRSSCSTNWFIKKDSEYKEATQEEFCDFIVEYKKYKCDKCLLEWKGGCC